MQRFDLKSLRSATTARTYPIGAEELHDAIERVVRELPGWSLAGLSEGEIRAVRRTRLFGFEDDVSNRVWEMRDSGISETPGPTSGAPPASGCGTSARTGETSGSWSLR